MVAGMYQNVRVSIDRIVRDLRLAGLGVSALNWDSPSTDLYDKKIDVTDGGGSPDSVTFVTASKLSTGTLSAAANTGSKT